MLCSPLQQNLGLNWRRSLTLALPVIVLCTCSCTKSSPSASTVEDAPAVPRNLKMHFGGATKGEISAMVTIPRSFVATYPMRWHIGTIDPRFGVTPEQVRTAFRKASGIWEQAAGKQFFRFGDSGFAVNLVYDERQAKLNEQNAREAELASAEGNVARSKEREREAVTRYESAKEELREEVDSFNRDLAEYNRRVEGWNESGGAPPDAAAELDRSKEELSREKERIQQDEQAVEELRNEANGLVDSHNQLAARYNEAVRAYNAEFARGDVQTIGECLRVGDKVESITVYAFNSLDHLSIVLAHELGHALGVQHVHGAGSIMSAVEKGDKGAKKLELSAADREALRVALGG